MVSDDLGLIHHFEPARGDTAPGESPTLLLLHGTGADENDLVPLGRSLDSEAALLSPRGQVSENGAPRWFRRHAEGVFDAEDLVARTHELADFVGAAVEHYQLDGSKIIAVGFSNGANIAAAMVLLRPEVLRAAALFAPMMAQSDVGPVDLSEVAIFIGAGRVDPIAPPEQAEALATLLSDRGASVELRWHRGGHGVDQSVLSAASSWLAKLRAATTDSLP